MYFLIFLAISLVLAIPTFGISLLLFFLTKNWFDKLAARAILNSAMTSLRTGEPQFLYHINQGGIRKVFDAFTIDADYDKKYYEEERATSYTGTINHPGYKGLMILNVMYTPRSGTKNTIIISAENV